jgi:hypothetical protein
VQGAALLLVGITPRACERSSQWWTKLKRRAENVPNPEVDVGVLVEPRRRQASLRLRLHRNDITPLATRRSNSGIV